MGKSPVFDFHMWLKPLRSRTNSLVLVPFNPLQPTSETLLTTHTLYPPFYNPPTHPTHRGRGILKAKTSRQGGLALSDPETDVLTLFARSWTCFHGLTVTHGWFVYCKSIILWQSPQSPYPGVFGSDWKHFVPLMSKYLQFLAKSVQTRLAQGP